MNRNIILALAITSAIAGGVCLDAFSYRLLLGICFISCAFSLTHIYNHLKAQTLNKEKTE